jgi:dihydroorotase
MLHYVKGREDHYRKSCRKDEPCGSSLLQVSVKGGYIREGYHADLVIVDLSAKTTVSKGNILYKCGWSPLEGMTFPAAVTHTFINGNLVYENGVWDESNKGHRLKFERDK